MKAFLLALAQLVAASTAMGVTLTVTSTDDGGAGSLRQAILDAVAGDTINFDLPLPAVITLTSDHLLLDKDLQIAGPGANMLTIETDQSTVFFGEVLQVPSGPVVAISGVTFSKGLRAGVVNYGTLTLTDCAVVGNSDFDFDGGAGGIYNGGTLNLFSTTVAENQTETDCPGIVSLGALTMTNCTVSDNRANPFLERIDFNTPSDPGGGLFAYGGSEVITNCTITGNQAATMGSGTPSGGNGIYVLGAAVQIKNTLIAGNGDPTHFPFSSGDVDGDLVSLGYNLIGTGAGATITPATGDQIGTAAMPIDPLLGPLADNGGPTQTHALLPGSPAIDQGGPVAGLTTDQRGQPRPVDDPATAPPTGGDNSDVGAFETSFSQSLNISTRAGVLTGDNILDGGFIITGTDSKTILIRGLGPSLTQFMLSSVLVNPVLELHGSSGLIALDDDWKDSQQAEIEATGIPPTYPAEAAMIKTLAPGSYTAVLRGKNGGTGTGLIEIYDLDPNGNSKLANLSTRGFVDTGDNVLIGGFITGGGAIPSQIVVRAIGPSLAAMQVANPLLDPILEIHDQNGAVIAFDDNWKDSQEPEIEATGLAPIDDHEAAILLDLTNAPYTAIVRGVADTVGVALVEVYNLD